MPVRAIVGAQWGDEGKGKITDLLAQDADLVMRFGGGSNAGHTVVNALGEFKLHAIPSGIFSAGAISLIGTGTVIDFDALAAETRDLESRSVSIAGLRISTRAHVVMPYHLLIDRLGDEAKGKDAIGTTQRGVGPAYVDKADRVGIQVGDLLEPDTLRRKLESVVPQKNRVLRDLYGASTFEVSELVERAERWTEQFGRYVTDQLPLVADALEQNRNILLEGQLGALRDLDWGTYPYVTSSCTLAGGGGVGGGVPPMYIDRVLGVVKAYTSAVGSGPFPVELHDEVGTRLRNVGKEFGATTGRPRRVGWFDAVATRYACRLNRFSGVALTKLDVLDHFSTVRICTAYRVGSKRFDSIPSTTMMEGATPVYEEMEGWQQPTENARTWADLPVRAQEYVLRLENLIGAPVQIISVGQAREQTILRAAPD